MKTFSPIIFLLSLTLSYTFASEHIISFEDGIPDNWTIEGGGQINTTTDHYKHGNWSLEWEWTKEASILNIDNPIYLEESSLFKNSGIRMWIYSSEPVEDSLTFEFFKGNEIQFKFKYSINYKGWRGTWIRYREDVDGFDWGTGLDNFKIKSPTTPGKVFFDLFEFSDNITGVRFSSYQFQVGTKESNAWATYKWSLVNPNNYIPLPDEITQEEIETFNTITQRIDDWILGVNSHPTANPYTLRKESQNSFIRRQIRDMNEFKMQRHSDGRVTGVPLFGRNSPYKPKMSEDVSQKLPLALALDYKLNGNNESLDSAMLVFDYLHDQGWAEGSTLGSLDHEINRISGYPFAVFLLRDELKQAGKLNREIATLEWFITFKQSFVDEQYEVTADALRNRAMYRLLLVMLMDDTPKKVQYAQGLLKYLNKALELTTGWATLKPDYTGYHHRFAYISAYTPNSFLNASLINYFLGNTKFALNENSKENLKNVLRTIRILANKYETPASTGGRIFSLDVTNQLIAAYAYMATIEDPVDPEMASILMRLWEPDSYYLEDRLFSKSGSDITFFRSLGEIEIMLDIVDKNIAPEPSPSGFWAKPFAGIAVQRRDEWLATVKGWSQYICDFESSGTENVFGRYLSYGNIQIQSNGDPVDHNSNGFRRDNGWDWTRWAGTTVINYPLKDIKHSGASSDHRNFSNKTFMGSLSFEDENGMWAMQLEDNKFNTGLKANKSVFFFDNQLICLGSDIESSVLNYDTETPLFQIYLNNLTDEIFINSHKSITEFPYNESINTSNTTWLLDNNNNAYILPEKQQIEIRKQEQTSRDHQDKKDTEGNYAVAWLNHGEAPENEEYEFTILINSTTPETEKYTNAIPYEIISKDSTAHIIHHNDFNTTAFAIFNHRNYTQQGLIKTVSEPVMIMYKEKDETSLTLSIVAPDFKRTHYTYTNNIADDDVFEAGNKFIVEVLIEGSWELDKEYLNAEVTSVSGQGTTLEFICWQAMTIEVNLNRIEDIIEKEDTNKNTLIAYPNPITDNSMKISIEIEKPTITTLGIFNQNGKIIDVIVNRFLEAGNYNFDYNTQKLNNGMYFLSLEIDNEQVTKKYSF